MRKIKQFWISWLIQRIIDYSLLEGYLEITTIKEKVLKERLLEHGRFQKKLFKKEKVDFRLIRIDRKNFSFKLKDLFEEVNKGELKLISASDIELPLFRPEFWRYIWNIRGMQILTLKGSSLLSGNPTYLVHERGFFTNKLCLILESEIFSNKKTIYVLAKKENITVGQVSQIKRQAIINNCHEKLFQINENIEILEKSCSNDQRVKISLELKEIEATVINLDNSELKQMIDKYKCKLCHFGIG